MTRNRWIMLTGTSPGAGKTTLSEGLTEALRTQGVAVDLVQEEAIFERAEFTEAGRAFKTRRWASAEELLAGYERLVTKAERDGSTVIFDWSAAAMAEDLPWAEEQAALNDHVRHAKAIVSSLNPIVLFLEAPLEAAVDRATAQRGAKWLAEWTGNPGCADPSDTASNRERALANIGSGCIGTERNRAAFLAAEWPLIDLDASQPASTVLTDALTVVSGESLSQVL